MIPENPVPIDSRIAQCTIEHTMNKSAKLAELRHSLARYGLPPDRPLVEIHLFSTLRTQYPVRIETIRPEGSKREEGIQR